MSAETLTYAAITDRLGFSSTIWGFLSRLRLPRQRRNNGNAAVDLVECPTVAAHSQEGDQSVVATLTARIEMLESEFARVEAAAAGRGQRAAQSLPAGGGRDAGVGPVR
jgi:hypothetical protein